MVRYGTVEFKKNRMRILSFRTQGNLLQYIKWYKLTLKSNKSKTAQKFASTCYITSSDASEHDCRV